MLSNAILVDARFSHKDQTVQGQIEVTENSVTVTIAGRDVKIELYSGSVSVEIFKGDAPDPYMVHVWTVEEKC
jgi:hypothetical protein